MSKSTFDGFNYYQELAKNLAKRQSKVNNKQISLQPKKRIRLLTKDKIVGNLLNKFANKHPTENNKVAAKTSPEFVVPENPQKEFPENSFFNLSRGFFIDDSNERKLALLENAADIKFIDPSTFLDHHGIISSRSIKETELSIGNSEFRLPSNITLPNNITLSSLKAFEPKKASTPLEGIPMVLDPDDVFKDISILKENDIDDDEEFHKKLLKVAGETTKQIHEITFQILRNPLESVIKSINRVNDISLEDSIRSSIINNTKEVSSLEQANLDEPFVNEVNATQLFSQLSCNNITNLDNKSCEKLLKGNKNFDFLPNIGLENNMVQPHTTEVFTPWIGKKVLERVTNKGSLFSVLDDDHQSSNVIERTFDSPKKPKKQVSFNLPFNDCFENFEDFNISTGEEKTPLNHNKTQMSKPKLESSHLSFGWTPCVHHGLVINPNITISSTPEIVFPPKNIFQNSFNMF